MIKNITLVVFSMVMLTFTLNTSNVYAESTIADTKPSVELNALDTKDLEIFTDSVYAMYEEEVDELIDLYSTTDVELTPLEYEKSLVVQDAKDIYVREELTPHGRRMKILVAVTVTTLVLVLVNINYKTSKE